MNTLTQQPATKVRINPYHQLSLSYHFLALSFTTTSLIMGVLVSQESLFIGLLALFFVGVNQLLSAMVGGLQYGRKWQVVHLLAAIGFIGIQVAVISIMSYLEVDTLPDTVIYGWLIANFVISLVAGWSYWFNLRASYAREASSSAAETASKESFI